MTTSRLLLAGLASAALVIAASAAPIITNGSFESPDTSNPPYLVGYVTGQDMPGWHVDFAAQDVVIINNQYNAGGVVWPDPLAGAAFLYLGDSGSVSTISQVVHLDGGHSYDLSFWLSDFQSPNYGARVTTDLNAVLGGASLLGGSQFAANSDANWDQYDYSFAVAASGDYKLSFTSLDNHPANLDEIVITDNGRTTSPVPDSGFTGGLLLGALAAMAALRRRLRC